MKKAEIIKRAFYYKPRFSNGRNGFVLLGSLLIMVFLTIMVGIALMRSNIQQRTTNQRRAIQEAFYAAEAGIERTIFELRRSPGWSPGENGQPEEQDVRLNRVAGDDATTIGFYSLEVKDAGILNGWNTRWVRSIGKDSLQSMTRIIVVRVIVENPARFLVSTLGDLRIGSGAAIGADVLAQNLYFEVNPSLPSPQRDINVDGDVFYINSITGENDPAVHYSAAAQVQKSPSITFVGVDLDRYRTLANNLAASDQGVYGNGNLNVDLQNLNSLSPGGSGPFTPQIIFAEGDITISGQYGHSMLVVAGGNVYIQGDITPHPAIGIRPQIGIFAKKDLIIPTGAVANNAHMDIEAFLMADGAGSSMGLLVAQAPKFSLGTLNFTGAIAVRGKGRTAIDLNAFDQRVYTFNPDLNINRQIPFVPFIVNVINWSEKTL